MGKPEEVITHEHSGTSEGEGRGKGGMKTGQWGPGQSVSVRTALHNSRPGFAAHSARPPVSTPQPGMFSPLPRPDGGPRFLPLRTKPSSPSRHCRESRPPDVGSGFSIRDCPALWGRLVGRHLWLSRLGEAGEAPGAGWVGTRGAAGIQRWPGWPAQRMAHPRCRGCGVWEAPSWGRRRLGIRGGSTSRPPLLAGPRAPSTSRELS